VVVPKLVAGVEGREGGIARVVSSDGAVVVLTARGDVLALHEYTTRKLGQRQHGVVQVQVSGGQLDPLLDSTDSIEYKLTLGGGSALTVFLLSSTGRLTVWGEGRDNAFIPCLYSVSREVVVTDVALYRGGLVVVGAGGEAWTATHQQGRAARSARAVTTDTIKLRRLPHVHRAVAAAADSKGRNFCVLQVAPNEALTLVPEVAASGMAAHMAALLAEVVELDELQDVTCLVAGRRFPAHAFVLASGSEALSKQIRFQKEEQEEVVEVHVDEVHPEVFRLVLQFLYTKTCDLFRAGAAATSLALEAEVEEQEVLTIQGDPSTVSAYQVYSENRNRKKKGSTKARVEKGARTRCPLALVLEAGRSLGVFGLVRAAEAWRVEEGVVVAKGPRVHTPIEFTFKHLPELQDVTIVTEEGAEVAAHRCLLVARSDYFAGMFAGAWAEASTALTLPIPAAIVEAVLDFLYRDSCAAVARSEDLEFVCNVLVVADQFLLTRLKELCEVQLARMLSLRNAAELLQFSSSYLAGQLQQSCSQFICLNLGALLEARALDLLQPDVFQQLDRFYQGSNPSFSGRRVRPAAGWPAAAEVEAEFLEEPATWEELEAAGAAAQQAGKASRPRRHSSGEGRARTTSMGSTGASTDEEEVEEGMDKLSLVDFEIEEREEEGESPEPAEPPAPSPVAKQEKKAARLSQKDRKRLSLETQAGKVEEAKAEAAVVSPGWLGWGAEPAATVAKSVSLQEIMAMESKAPAEGKKTSPTPPKVEVVEKRSEKKKWKKISLSEEVVEVKQVVTPSAISNPWNLPNTPTPDSGRNILSDFQKLNRRIKVKKGDTFEQIMLEEVKQEENLHLVRNKPLAVTQVEERAIEELRAFYGAGVARDEVITVTRVQRGVIAPAVWRRNK